MIEESAANIFVMMGVSGSGKTTIGSLLAKRLGAAFADADDFHSEANKRKMHDGIPLTDEDRAPWLLALNGLLLGWVQTQTKGVLACSALKSAYRDTLKMKIPEGALAFIWLDGSPRMIAARLSQRKGTYMNPALLGSQIATLEPPADALRIVNGCAPDQVVDEILLKAHLQAS